MKMLIRSQKCEKEFLRGIIYTVALALAIALISIAPFLIKDNGVFLLRDDFNFQQIPFSVNLHRYLRECALSGFNWNVDLGGSALVAYSFYELGSPFFWLSLLFPETWFPYIVGYILVIKYMVAALSAYLYISAYVKNKGYAVFGAVTYAFSGFQASNLLFYHFHDVVAFFPLLLLGLDQLMEDNRRKKRFILIVFLCAMVNYYFFVIEVVFLIIYFLFRYFTRDVRLLIKRIGSCLYCGLLGIGLSGIIFVPSIIYILGGSRSESGLYLEKILYDPRYIMFLLRGILLPAEPMHDYSAVIDARWNSTSLYLPFVGMTLVLAYIMKKRDWLSRLLITLLIISFSEILSSGFLMFTEGNQRWWFTLVLMCALAGAIVLDNAEEYNIIKACFICLASTLLFSILILTVKWSEEYSIVYHGYRFMLLTGISIAGIVMVAVLVKVKQLKPNLLFAIAAVFSVLTTAYVIHFYQNNTEPAASYMSDFEASFALDSYDEQYRYNVSEYNLYTMVGRPSGVGSFITTKPNSIESFNEIFGYYSVSTSLDKNGIEGLAEVLGGRYEIMREEPEDGVFLKRIETSQGEYFIKEKPALPIGYKIDAVIPRSSVINTEPEKRGIVMLLATIVDDSMIGELSDVVRVTDLPELNLTGNAIDYLSSMDIEAIRVKNFKRDHKGFSCETDYEEESLVYFSVPYDEGFSLFIDGEKAEIMEACGMMLIRVPGGKHAVRFDYCTPGYYLGLVISIFSIVLFVLHMIAERFVLCSVFKNAK